MNAANHDSAARRDTPLLTRAEFAETSFMEQATYLCLLGHLAPSSHNTQPWRFALDATECAIHVCLDRTAVLAASDTKGRQAVISVGCAVEYVTLAAEYYGIGATVEIQPVTQDAVSPTRQPEPRTIRLCSIRWSTGSEFQGDDRLISAMFTRKVVRAEFDSGVPVAGSVVAALRNASGGLTAHLRLLTTSDPNKRLLAELQGQADSYAINSPAFRKELGDWLLPNDADSPVGMPGIGFGLDDEEARRIHEGLSGAGSLYPEDGLKFALAGKRSIEAAPLVGLVTVPQDDIPHWLDAGRTLARALLVLEGGGFQAGVHAGIVEVPLIRRMIPSLDGQVLAALFRAGRVRNPAHAARPFSPRLSMERVLVNTDGLSQ